jgi:hypothetical protein
MLLLVAGASGAGKSTVRRSVGHALSPEVIEPYDVVGTPASPTIAWRQQSTEAVVQRALELGVGGRHLLLSGDPVAASEVVAAPSAAGLDGIAVCLLDGRPEVQAARLAQRGDDRALLVHHRAFADWMRAQARDPQHMPQYLPQTGGRRCVGGGSRTT